MAALPISQPTAPPPTETIEDRFTRLAAEWQQETAHHSSSNARDNHPAYQEIIGMGKAVIPLLLRDLEQNHRRWFAALKVVTGADPVPPADAGRLPRMTEAWLQWGKENGWIA